MAIYDQIGRTYATTRIPDQRLAAAIASQLTEPESTSHESKTEQSKAMLTIADVGAGTGNYSNLLAGLGHQVVAVEPSVVMRSQAEPHANVTWYEGIAEQLPLQDNSVDHAISQLSLHHFSDRPQALQEMVRVVRPGGRLVFFTFDIRQCEPFWLTDLGSGAWKERYGAVLGRERFDAGYRLVCAEA